MKLTKVSLPFLAFLQATALVVYVGLVATIFSNGEALFGKLDNYLGPVLFLLIFIVSAVISATIFLGRAGFLFWEKHYRESFTLLGWTVSWGLFYIIGILVFIFSQIN